MIQIFGSFREDIPTQHDYLVLGISNTSRPLRQRWRNNKLSAYFVADYLSTFLPIRSEDASSHKRRAELKVSVSYVANELLENAVKYNALNGSGSIKFAIHLIENEKTTVIIYTTNGISSKGKEQYQEFIQELMSSDLEDLYIRQLEKSAELENHNASGLGLITTVNDYSAQLGWKFETVQKESEMFNVTTMAQLVV